VGGDVHPKLERLLNLTALLLDARQPIPAEQVHAKIESYPSDRGAFRRAFERDKEELRAMGIPLVLEAVPGVLPEVQGYRIPRDRYYLRDPQLSAEELAALHLAASAVQVEGAAAAEGLQKLGGAVAGGPAGALGIDVELPTDPNLARPLRGRRRAPPRAPHVPRRGAHDRPHRLEYQRGRWYVSGFDHLRGEERVFRVDRIEGEVDLTDDPTFEPPRRAVPGAARAPWELGSGDPVRARMRVDATQAPWAVHHVGPAAVVAEHPDGSIDLELPVTNADALRSFVLSFLDHAELLEPPDLRADVVAWLEAQVGPDDEPAGRTRTEATEGGTA
jgi:proteasome accessory factor B